MGSKGEMERKYNLSGFIPKSNLHNPLCVPFAGSAVVALNHMHKSGYHASYLNDASGELINFWTVVRDHPVAFEEKIKYLWLCKNVELWELGPDSISMAAKFWLDHQNISRLDKVVHPDKDITKWANILNAGRISITDKDYIDFCEYLLKLYKNDCKCSFYCDPPYRGTASNINNKGYKSLKFDEDALFDILKKINDAGHYVLLSYIWETKFAERLMEMGWFVKKYEIDKNNIIKNRSELLASNEPFRNRFVKYNNISNFF